MQSEPVKNIFSKRNTKVKDSQLPPTDKRLANYNSRNAVMDERKSRDSGHGGDASGKSSDQVVNLSKAKSTMVEGGSGRNGP